MFVTMVATLLHIGSITTIQLRRFLWQRHFRRTNQALEEVGLAVRMKKSTLDNLPYE